MHLVPNLDFLAINFWFVLLQVVLQPLGILTRAQVGGTLNLPNAEKFANGNIVQYNMALTRMCSYYISVPFYFILFSFCYGQ